MAKQTFTTGSVLTATQMNNLQANDYNWTVSQKTASYVLVAADAGTRIEMNSGSATTVTVNTGLFTAGDTLFIQNIGAGACTVTAGTATVNKTAAGSLTLAQYQGGTLYFVSASSAIFFADAGYTPPLTTKGDLFGYDTAAARIPIGANNTVLTADSTQALGLKWASAPAPSYTWTSFTPRITQSGIMTFSSNDSQFVVIGNLVFVRIQVTFSNAGTAGSLITWDLNTTDPNPPGGYPMANIGSGIATLYDASAATGYTGATESQGNYLYFRSGVNKATYSWGATGSDFALALASGDILTATLMYRKP